MRKVVLIALIIFLFSFSLRLWNIHDAGRWSDEEGFELKGYRVINLLERGDVLNSYFYKDGADHPLFAIYFYGLTALMDLRDINHQNIDPITNAPTPILYYDLIYGKVLVAILTSISVILVFIFGSRYFSYFVGISSSIIMAMMPHFMGYSQFVGLEAFVMITFTVATIAYICYLDSRKLKYLVLSGIFVGLCVSVKQSGVLIYALIPILYLIKKYLSHKNNVSPLHLLWIFIISIVAIFITYPMPFFHPIEFWQSNYDLWFKNSGRIPEVLFGRVMGAPFFYYVIAFFVTTPVIIILLSFLGGIRILKSKKWIYWSVLAWLLVPFLMSFFHARQHMVRYIIQFYAPLSLVAAIGLEYIAKKYFQKVSYQYLILIPLFIYLLIILLTHTPYYLSYYNELVGGTKNVYDKKLFMIGWFGEGLRGPGLYLAKNAKAGSLIGHAFNPAYSSMYKVDHLSYEQFDARKRYDYVVVNYYNVIRLGFDYKVLKDYDLVYREKVSGIDMARVYKRRSN